MTSQPPEIKYDSIVFQEATRAQRQLLGSQLNALADLALSPAAFEAGIYGPAIVERRRIRRGTDEDEHVVLWKNSDPHNSWSVYIGDRESEAPQYFLEASEHSDRYLIDGIASRMTSNDATYAIRGQINKNHDPGHSAYDLALDFPRIAARYHHTRIAENTALTEIPTGVSTLVGISQNRFAAHLVRIGSYASQAALRLYEAPLRPEVTPTYRMANSLLGLLLSRAKRSDNAEWLSPLFWRTSGIHHGVAFEDGEETFVTLHQPAAASPVLALTVMKSETRVDDAVVEGKLPSTGTQYCIYPDNVTMQLNFLTHPVTRQGAVANLSLFAPSGSSEPLDTAGPEVDELNLLLERLLDNRLKGRTL